MGGATGERAQSRGMEGEIVVGRGIVAITWVLYGVRFSSTEGERARRLAEHGGS